MSAKDSPPDNFPMTIEGLLRALQEQVAKQQQVEAAAWAKLTRAQQRATLDARRAAEERRRREKLDAKLRAPAQWLAQRESCTIEAFAECLAGLSPNYSESWGFFHSAEYENSRRYFEVLTSFVGVTLAPLNPEQAVNKQQFRIVDLFAASERKNVGLWVELRAAVRSHALTLPALDVQLPSPRTDELRSAAATTGTGPTWQPQADNFLEIVHQALARKHMRQEVFCAKGTMKALHRAFLQLKIPKEEWETTVGQGHFGDYVNSHPRGFKFARGGRDGWPTTRDLLDI